ncbi:MAG TPA: hypothetical protein VM938_03495 [Acidimicrobiales bacterium]|nr:hypothetical protein [Acidimicrobiales bacterium]
MKIKTTTVLAIGSVALIGLAGWGVARLAGGEDTAAPVAATSTTSTTLPDPNSPPSTDDPKPLAQLWGFGDRGDATQVAAVRSAVPDLIRRANLALAMPSTPAERASVLNDGAKRARRTAELLDVFTDSVAAETVRSMENTLRQVQADPNYKGFSDYRLTIEEWYGVIVDGNKAFAGFLGFESYLTPRKNGWSDEGKAPWHVWLERDGDVWKLVTFKARPGPVSAAP